MANHAVYLDYAAATPLDGRVLIAMKPYFSELFYNPSSSYLAAKQAKQALEDARARLAHWLGARPAEVIFTAGATESINLAVHGIMGQFPGAEVIVAATEHPAVLEAAARYKRVLAPVLEDGTADLARLNNLITDNTVLLSMGYANNEIGTIQPLREIAQIITQVRRLRQLKNNPLPLYLHTDASQAACHLSLQVNRLGADLMTINGGKMYGPKQTGVLFAKAGVKLKPQILGGGQEGGLRSGTENIAGAVGLAAALDIAQGERREASQKAAALRDELQRIILQTFPEAKVNGSQKRRLPHILNVSFQGVDGERLIMALDENGVMASTGSACAANKQTASHVLRAIGLDEKLVQGSLRLSVGRPSSQDQVALAGRIIAQTLSGIAP